MNADSPLSLAAAKVASSLPSYPLLISAVETIFGIFCERLFILLKSSLRSWSFFLKDLFEIKCLSGKDDASVDVALEVDGVDNKKDMEDSRDNAKGITLLNFMNLPSAYRLPKEVRAVGFNYFSLMKMSSPSCVLTYHLYLQ